MNKILLGGVNALKAITLNELDNGLTYIIWENNKSDVVEIRMYVQTGSIYEEDFWGSGISHLLEHLTAEGPTLRKSKKEVDELMIKFGNAFNAYVTKDHTAYHITTVKKFYEEAISLLGELVFENKITQKAFKRERGVISREIEKSLEEPERVLYQLTLENLYKIHPARFPVIGYRKLFEKITYEDVKNYYSKKYAPNNAVIVIGGNVKTDKIKEILQKNFSHYERNIFQKPTLPIEPDILNIREKRTTRDIEGSYINISWLTIPLTGEDLYSLDLLSEILSSGRSSRLNRIIKEEKELVNSIDSYSHTPSYGRGEFSVLALFKDKNENEVVKEILKIIADIQKNGVSENELQLAKNLVLSSYLFEKTSITGRTSAIVIDYISANDVNFSKKYVEEIKKVSASEVQAAAVKYLNLDRYVKTVVTNFDAQKAVDEKIITQKEEETKKIILDNGIKIIFKKIPDISVISYSLFLKGGATYNKHYNTDGAFNMLASMLSRGTEKYTREELSREFERRGASFSASAGNNTFYIRAVSLKDDYATILKLIYQIIEKPIFNEKEFQKAKRFTIDAIEQQNNDWQTEAFLNFKKHIFPENTPYIHSSLGTVESVKNISRELLMKIHSEFVIPSNMVISVVGDFNFSDMENEIKSLFSGFSEKKSLPDYEKSFIVLEQDISKKYSTQKEISTIFKGFPTVTLFEHNERAVIDIIDVIISVGSFPSGWLHERLREKELVYVVHAYNLNFIKSGCFAIFAATNPEKLAETEKIIKDVIEDLRNYKFSDEEIKKAKDQIITAHQLSLQTPVAQSQNYALNEIFGFGYDFDNKYLEMIKDVKRSDIERAVQKYFKNSLTVITSPNK